MLPFLDYDPDDIDVRVSELLTATSDGGDPLVHPKQFIRDAAQVAAKATATSIQVGTHLSTPVVMEDGSVYGTLCCFSHTVQPNARDLDLRRLQIAAKVLAEDLLQAGIGGELQLAPLDGDKSPRGGFQGSLGEPRNPR
jgi:hypothetical protein